MKIISGMLGVLMSTSLALPLHADEVDYMVVKQDTFAGAKNLDSLDELVDTFHLTIDTYFKQKTKNEDGNLRLDSDQALIIKGGKGTIGLELDRYNDRAIHNSSERITYNVGAYSCYVKPLIGKAKAYVIVVGDSQKWANNLRQWGQGQQHGWCTGKWEVLIPDTTAVGLASLSKKVKNIKNIN
jgi:hypothetical protein